MAFLRGVFGFGLGRLRMYEPRPIALPEYRAPGLQAASALKFSLVTPVFNQAAFIATSIESVLAQEYPSVEYIVMDGASTDGTAEIVASYANRLAYVQSAKDRGQADAINQGFAHTSGEILGWLNGDDILLPGALAAIAGFLDAHPDVDVVYGDRIIIDENGLEIGRWMLPPYSGKLLSWIDYVPQETLFWRRSVWERIGGKLDANFQFAMDWDLLIRFRDCGARIAHMPRFIGAFRVHPAQKTSAQIKDVGQAEMDRIRRRCLGYVPSRLHRRVATAIYAGRYLFHDLRRRLGLMPRSTPPFSSHHD